MPHTIQYWQWQYRVKAKALSTTAEACGMMIIEHGLGGLIPRPLLTFLT